MNQEAASHPSQSQINTLSNVSVGKDFIFQPTQIMYVSVDEIKTRELKPASPYKGLKKFTKDDKQHFFGRDQLILKLMQDLNRSNLILLLGASGSGKSSVVLAGLIPRLQENWGTNFTEVIFKPDRDPFLSLFSGFLVKGFNQAEVSLVLSGEAGTLNNTVATLRRDGSRWLIYIDQFEELFTISDPVKRDSFIAGLVQLHQSLEAAQENSVKIVMTMRADFLDRFSRYPELGSLIQGNMRLITDMHRDELWLAIEQPAAQQGVVFEEGLIDEIIKDFQGQAGTLPLLQYTLDLLWKNDNIADPNDATKPHHSTDRTLNKSTYRNLGGVRKALETHVTEVFESFNPEEKEAARQIFLSLVDVTASTGTDTGIKAVSRRANRSKFLGDLVNTLLDRLIDENLLTSNKISGQEATVEVAHEALLSSWDKLKEWINEAHQVIAIKNRIEQSAKQRKEALKDSSEVAVNDEYCLRGSQLETALEQRNNGTFNLFFGGLSQEENEFIDISLEWRDRIIREQQEQIQKLERALTEIQLPRETEKVLQLLPVEPIKAYELAIQCLDKNLKKLPDKLLTPVLGSFQVLMQFNEENKIKRSGINALAINSDNNIIATGHTDGTLQFWDLWRGTSKQKVKAHTVSVNSVAFSSNGEFVATVGYDNSSNGQDTTSTLRLWNFQGLCENEPFLSWEQNSYFVVFDSEGSTILSSNYSKLCLLNLEGDLLNESIKAGGRIHCAAYSPDGWTIVTASADDSSLIKNRDRGVVCIWSYNGVQSAEPFPSSSLIESIVFSPDGQTIVGGGRDGKIYFWNLQGHTLKEFRTDRDASIYSIAFKPDGKTLVSGNNNCELDLWNSDGRLKPPIRGHVGRVKAVAFTLDGNRIVSGDDEGQLFFWDAEGNPIFVDPFHGHQGDVVSVAFNRSGNMIVSAGEEGTLCIWNLEGKLVIPPIKIGQPFSGRRGDIRAAFSSNGTTIVSINGDNDLGLWNLQGNSISASFENPLQGGILSKIPIYCIASHPTQEIWVSGDNNGSICLWDFQGNSLGVLAKELRGRVYSVVFSPDGKQLVSGDDKGHVYLWSMEEIDSTPSSNKAFNGRYGEITCLDFSLNGEMIIGGDIDSKLWLWNLKGELIAPPFQTDQRGGIVSVVFNRTSDMIISTHGDRELRFWDLEGNQIGQPFKDALSAAFSPKNDIIIYGGSGVKSGRLHKLPGTLKEWLQSCCNYLQDSLVLEDENGQVLNAYWACLKYINSDSN